jgi:hypothetical protein
LGSVSRTDAKTEGGGGKKHGLHDLLSWVLGSRFTGSPFFLSRPLR